MKPYIRDGEINCRRPNSKEIKPIVFYKGITSVTGIIYDMGHIFLSKIHIKMRVTNGQISRNAFICLTVHKGKTSLTHNVT